MIAEMLPPHDADAIWWPIRCMLRGAVPAPQVIERLKQLPPSAAIAYGNISSDPPADEQDPDSDDASPQPDSLNEVGQRAFLHLLSADPVLALLGLRRSYRRSLLRRLLAEVESRRLAVCDELAGGYAELLAGGGELQQEEQEAALAGLPACVDPRDSSWLFKTFAYGPAPHPPGPAVNGASSSGGSAAPSSSSSSSSSPCPAPLPAGVVQRHVAHLAAALGRSGGGGSRGEGGGGEG
ncbi:hypothetical protein Agub_g7213, partial [Astrephomene gubernaculifera]